MPIGNKAQCIAVAVLIVLVVISIFTHVPQAKGVATWVNGISMMTTTGAAENSSSASITAELQISVEAPSAGSNVSASRAIIDGLGSSEGRSLNVADLRAAIPVVSTTSVFGTEIADPVASRDDEWCATELSPSRLVPYQYDHRCTQDILRQGNFSAMEDLTRFFKFPSFSGREHLNISDSERAKYWARNPSPYGTHCGKCDRDLVHQTLYRARRWWKLRATTTEPSSAQRLGGTFFNMHENWFELHDGLIAGHALQIDRPGPNMKTVIPLNSIKRLTFCLNGDDSFVSMGLNVSDVVHSIQFLLPLAGARCFWRSIQLLLPALSAISHIDDNSRCKYGIASPKKAENPMPRDETMPYTPCHAFDFSKMGEAVKNSGQFGKMMTFWPFKCSALRQVAKCEVNEVVERRSRSVSQKIEVAVALAGFLRSFGNARVAIHDKMVKPHNATLFVATWNVIGRAKKSVTIVPKMIISTANMFRSVAGMMGLTTHEPFQRLEVLDYKRHAKMQQAVKANGFQHPGLYFAQVRVLQLVINSNASFDVVIRSRTDVFPAVPFRFTRMRTVDDVPAHGPYEYALNLGSSCLMDGMWWPQWARFGDGKLLKHYADTRMKYFSWQVCDWIEIGTFRTMSVTARLYDWVQENNVFSAAQFVEHAFYVDQNISYQPLQLYLKIMRHKGQFFG